jgi:hypothetical protein
MVLWIAMLIVQPFLIKFKKRAIHKTIGKISYVLVPLVLISGFLMVRHTYYILIGDLQQKVIQESDKLSNEQILQQAATYEAIAIFYLSWFALFYTLAVINRRNSTVHARYMLAAALPLLGPTVDRTFYFYSKLPNNMPYELPSFIIIDIVLAILLWKDYKNKRPTITLWVCLLIYVIGQVLYFTVTGTEGWQHLVTFIMKPKL